MRNPGKLMIFFSKIKNISMFFFWKSECNFFSRCTKSLDFVVDLTGDSELTQLSAFPPYTGAGFPRFRKAPLISCSVSAEKCAR